ncbi:hypothetical protein SAMN05216552_10822 [Pseudoduganella namucuonensis]|uniref:DUF6396 domain-containing protein n=2 Tax=Pseudoduganella namucuonensis TaxID=1035707 RepID=A0A1I7M7N0_9BURK|nr:hypothetical protein SAMN05216552_10822 [Pseudoduganella namucuonensis]
MHSIPAGFSRFDVSAPIPRCGRWKDHMPSTRDAVVYERYIAARKLWRSKIEWQLTLQETQSIFADVSFAAGRGDWGAKALLAYFYLNGLGPMPSNHVVGQEASKAVAIAQQAAAAGQPWGIYDLGVAHQHGYGGAHYDLDLVWAYYLKAAQMGSPEAQMALAEAYGGAGRLDDEEAMLLCAFGQEHGAAAYQLGLQARIMRQYPKALATYQAGVKFGCKDCADALYLLFTEGYWGTAKPAEIQVLSALGVVADPERSARYEAISNALQINPDLKLGRLDEFLPLPPAKLPEWRGVSDVITPEPDGPPTY